MNNDCCIKSIAVSNVSDCAVQGLRLRGTKKREDNRTENVCLARHSYFLCVVFNGHDDDDVIFMCVCVWCVCALGIFYLAVSFIGQLKLGRCGALVRSGSFSVRSSSDRLLLFASLALHENWNKQKTKKIRKNLRNKVKDTTGGNYLLLFSVSL